MKKNKFEDDGLLSFLNKLDKDILIDLLAYIKKYDYENEFKIYFLKSFKRIYDAYYDYNLYDTDFNITKPDIYARKFLDILIRVGEINFIKDINNDKFLISNVIKVDALRKPTIGYIKDENGHFQISPEPKYTADVWGYAEIGEKNVDILYDTVTLNDDTSIYSILFHELTHTEQKGFNLYWYILNFGNFYKMLIEGQAIKTARRLKTPGTDACDIPFSIDIINNKFKIYDKHIEYAIYRYIYFKFEFLLGEQFMNEWATTKDSEHYFELAYKNINNTYGEGTFEKLYINSELILTAFRKFKGESLDDEINNLNQFTIIDDAKYQKMIIKSYNELYSFLNDNNKFEKMYQNEREILVKAIEIGKKFEKNTQTLNNKLNKLTRESYRKSYEQDLLDAKYKKQVYENLELFNNFKNLNQQIYSITTVNPGYLTDAVVNLELLMIKCLETIKPEEKNYMFDYYRYNVFSNKFYFPMMSEVKKEYDKLNYIKSRVNTNTSDLEGLERLTKKLLESSNKTKVRKQKK